MGNGIDYKGAVWGNCQSDGIILCPNCGGGYMAIFVRQSS